MSLWNKLFGRGSEERVDYYEEGLHLLRAGSFHEALTSFRLALREAPNDTTILMQIAVAYTRIGMTEEAIKTYQAVLRKQGQAAGAHYGLAFLLLHEGRQDEAVRHLRSFLKQPPDGPEAGRHIAHARQTLAQLTDEGGAGERPLSGPPTAGTL